LLENTATASVAFSKKAALFLRGSKQLIRVSRMIMEEKTFQRIKELTELQGTSGFEHDVRAYMREAMTPLVDEIQQDGLGGIFGLRHHQEADAPRVMLAAHMDEVGFLLTTITDRGLFKVTPLGGWNPYVVSAQRFTLKTAKGDYPCVSSSVPPHLLRGSSGQKNVEVVLNQKKKQKALAYVLAIRSSHKWKPSKQPMGKTSSRKLGTTVTAVRSY
jgi:glutamyl aminopeptidase